jgi:hypothetical protein
LYRLIKNCEARTTHSRDRTNSEKPERTELLTTQPKPLHNPFFNINTVVCFTMVLNDPTQQKKQSLFDVPAQRATMSANRRSISISKPSLSKSMAFSLSGDGDGQYWRKLKNFFDFIFKINYSNNIYVCLELAKPEETISSSKFKVYIGKGNNSLLIRSLMKRRFWW